MKSLYKKDDNGNFVPIDEYEYSDIIQDGVWVVRTTDGCRSTTRLKTGAELDEQFIQAAYIHKYMDELTGVISSYFDGEKHTYNDGSVIIFRKSVYEMAHDIINAMVKVDIKNSVNI